MVVRQLESKVHPQFLLPSILLYRWYIDIVIFWRTVTDLKAFVNTINDNSYGLTLEVEQANPLEVHFLDINDRVEESHIRISVFHKPESLAILRALHYIKKEQRTFKNKAVYIFTDSKVALHQIQNLNVNLPIIRDTINALNHLNGSTVIALAWTKGHSGNRGNDRADFLAKKATHNLDTSAYSKVPYSWMANQLLSYIYQQWQRNWDSSSTGRTTYCFFPLLANRARFDHFTPSYELTQIMTGHGNFKGYLAHFLGKGNGQCHCSLNEWDDSDHLLFHCPLYENKRRQLIQAVMQENEVWPCPASLLLSNKDIFTKFNEFIRQIKVLS
ncbi:uncharacterized protein LOC111618280 [Centruroides sculpturatus]|uniref:uncharacterized protein LOC111618280 n=1 Tax=Centruroides sculpturatus TaxID=218467 RepID=UPI000C6CE96F|nr:uncharacterized protein LOC111618280 [Centruroides sculpturatus]